MGRIGEYVALVIGLFGRVRRKGVWLVIVGLAFPALLYFIAPKSMFIDNNSDYAPQVANLLAGKWLVNDLGKVMCRYPPLFPLLLSGVYVTCNVLGVSAGLGIVAFTSFCIAAGAVALYAIGRMLMSEEAAMLSGLLFIFHPYIFFGVFAPLSETPFLVVLIISVAALLKVLTDPKQHAPFWAVFSGAALGASMLIRPVAFLLPAVFGAIIIVALRRILPGVRRWGLCVSLLSAALLMVLPWEMFVHDRNADWVILSNGGVPSMRDGLSFNNKPHRQPTWLPADVDTLTREIWSTYENLHSTNDIRILIAKQFKKTPTAVIKLFLIKAVRSWYGVESQQLPKELGNAAITIFTLIPAVLGSVLMWRKKGRSRVFVVLLVILAVYFWLITILVLSIVRYMVPVLAFTLLPTALLLTDASGHSRNADSH